MMGIYGGHKDTLVRPSLYYDIGCRYGTCTEFRDHEYETYYCQKNLKERDSGIIQQVHLLQVFLFKAT